MDDLPTLPGPFEATANGEELTQPVAEEGVEVSAPRVAKEQAFDATGALLLLLVGALLEGNDALLARLRRWQAETATHSQHADGMASKNGSQWLSHSLIGLLLHTPAALQRQWALAEHLSQSLFHLMALPMRPITRSRLMRPARRRFGAFVAEGESTVATWAAAGQAQESQARAMAQMAVNDVIDELIRHLSENPELAEMVQTQSVGLAGEVTDNIRSRTVTADTAVERLARALLRRERLREGEEATADERTEGVAGG